MPIERNNDQSLRYEDEFTKAQTPPPVNIPQGVTPQQPISTPQAPAQQQQPQEGMIDFEAELGSSALRSKSSMIDFDAEMREVQSPNTINFDSELRDVQAEPTVETSIPQDILGGLLEGLTNQTFVANSMTHVKSWLPYAPAYVKIRDAGNYKHQRLLLLMKRSIFQMRSGIT